MGSPAGLVTRLFGSCRPCGPDGSCEDTCRSDSSSVFLGFELPLCLGSCGPCRPEEIPHEGTEEMLHIGARPTSTPALERKVIEIRRTATHHRLGIDIDRSDNMTLLVVNVGDGLVKQWNVEHPDDPVKMGDRIIEVNGAYGDADQMLLRLTQDSVNLSETLLTIQRADVDVASVQQHGLAVSNTLDQHEQHDQ